MSESTTPYFLILFAILYYLIQREERVRPCKSLRQRTAAGARPRSRSRPGVARSPKQSHQLQQKEDEGTQQVVIPVIRVFAPPS